jgi:cytochrome c oxidase accessory protein FixG
MSHLDELRSTGNLFEARHKVFPRKIDGPFRRLKWAIMAVTLTIYYVTPWLRWDRGPYAPDQAVLVDLANRRFYMFAIEIWPHEFYYVTGLLVMAGIGLFLVTSAVGRAWCGYACPQTVWTDLFQHIERAIDGDRNAQIRLDRAPWGVEKIGKRLAKWSAWLLVAMATGGAWIFYFADAPTLARQFIGGDAPWVAYSTVGVLTATTFIFGGFLREQVCMYMCPWPRIQGAMLDENSLVVTYKDWRGEPRSHGTKRTVDLIDTRVGDCIDCNACVAVCPTGVDIRNGGQIGCITCGLCIDACDAVMVKLDREPRLIGYTTAADAAIARAGGAPLSPLKRLFRPRTVAYFLIWGSVGALMLFALGSRTRIDMAVQRDRNPIYVRLSGGAIRNSYTVKIRNMESRPRPVEVRVDGLPGAVLWQSGAERTRATSTLPVQAPADAVVPLRLFVAAPAAGEERSNIVFSVRATDDEGGTAHDATVFERPEESE